MVFRSQITGTVLGFTVSNSQMPICEKKPGVSWWDLGCGFKKDFFRDIWKQIKLQLEVL